MCCKTLQYHSYLYKNNPNQAMHNKSRKKVHTLVLKLCRKKNHHNMVFMIGRKKPTFKKKKKKKIYIYISAGIQTS